MSGEQVDLDGVGPRFELTVHDGRCIKVLIVGQ